MHGRWLVSRVDYVDRGDRIHAGDIIASGMTNQLRDKRHCKMKKVMHFHSFGDWPDQLGSGEISLS